ncbi:hypothetical protein HK098_005543 [Nowakowskiella sp. JEL0407]|nr:hypothetical protein HK098_005543 [Nowakowskiella sp. JEL0407]
MEPVKNQERRKKNLLVILDLNGTLFERFKKNNLVPLCVRSKNADVVINRAKPYLDTFLLDLFSMCTVAAWTSATVRNAIPMFQETFGECVPSTDQQENRETLQDDSGFYEKLLFKWDRSHCDLVFNPEAKGKFDSKKDLEKVWNDGEINGDKLWNQALYFFL